MLEIFLLRVQNFVGRILSNWKVKTNKDKNLKTTKYILNFFSPMVYVVNTLRSIDREIVKNKGAIFNLWDLDWFLLYGVSDIEHVQESGDGGIPTTNRWWWRFANNNLVVKAALSRGGLGSPRRGTDLKGEEEEEELVCDVGIRRN